MNTTIKKFSGGLLVQATIPKSIKNNTRKSIKTWRIKCLNPDLAAIELKTHLRNEILPDKQP